MTSGPVKLAEASQEIACHLFSHLSKLLTREVVEEEIDGEIQVPYEDEDVLAFLVEFPPETHPLPCRQLDYRYLRPK